MNCSARIFSTATSARTSVGHPQVGGVPDERSRAGGLAGGGDRGRREPPDELAGQPLQRDGRGERGVVLADGVDHRQIRQPLGGGDQVIGGHDPPPMPLRLAEPAQHRGGVIVGQHPHVDPAGDDAVLDVVHRVRDVVGPVHDLGLQTRAVPRGPSRTQSAAASSSV